MFEVYFDNPVSSEINQLRQEKEVQAERIEHLMKNRQGTIFVDSDVQNLRSENKSLLDERNHWKHQYNRLKGIFDRLRWKNNEQVPKYIKDEVYERDNYKCLCCGAKNDLTIDHIIPRVDGGLNEVENLQVLCKQCNLSKGTKTVDYRTVKPLIVKK